MEGLFGGGDESKALSSKSFGLLPIVNRILSSICKGRIAKALEFGPANGLTHRDGEFQLSQRALKGFYTTRCSAYVLSTPGLGQVGAVLLELAVLGS